MKPIKELGLELFEVGDNTYLVKGDTQGVVMLDLEHLKEMKWEVIASVKPFVGLPLLVIEDEASTLAEKEAKEIYPHDSPNIIVAKEFIELGYNKARETYKFTEEHLTAIRNKIVGLLPTGDVKAWDLIKAIQEYTKWFDEYVESISQKELHIEVELSQIKVSHKTGYTVEKFIPKVENNQIKAVWK